MTLHAIKQVYPNKYRVETFCGLMGEAKVFHTGESFTVRSLKSKKDIEVAHPRLVVVETRPLFLSHSIKPVAHVDILNIRPNACKNCATAFTRSLKCD